MENASPEQLQAQMQEWARWMQGLAAKGKLGGSQPLMPTGKTVHSPKKIVTDGPFVEGKEMVGGYLICKADTYEEAVEDAKGCPILNHPEGNVEVREIKELKF